MVLLVTIPGAGEHLGLVMAAEIADIARFPGPLRPGRVRWPGAAGRAVRPEFEDRSTAPRLARASLGGDRSRSARGDRPTLELARSGCQSAHRQVLPAKSAAARKVLIAAWHVLSREQAFRPSTARVGDDPVPASSHFHLAA